MSEVEQPLEIRLLKAASAIYVAVDKEVADSISGLLQEAANAIAAARAEALEDAKKACSDLYEAGVMSHMVDPSGNYIAKANGARECEQAIEALKEKKS